jgi:surface carbohydrate biosynthesis protein
MSFKSKLLFIIKFLLRVKISFYSPKENDLIIYDNTSIEILQNTFLKKFKYFVFEDRYYLITKIYLSPKIIFNTIKNINHGLKRAYKISLIKCVNPKLIVTYVHNSQNFTFFAKFFNGKINFLAIQNGNTYHKIKEDNYQKITRNYYIPHLLKLGYFEDDSFQNSNWKINKSDYVGSLRFDNFLKQVKIKNIDLQKKYDLCILSDFGAWEINEKIISDGFRDITKFAIRYAKDNNLRCVIALKRENPEIINLPEPSHVNGYIDEQLWYKNNFSYEELVYLKKNFIYNNSISSYMCAIQSDVTIGGISTLLREITAYNKKFLACNFTSNEVYDFPINGICSLNYKCDYFDFSKRLDQILELSNSNFYDSLNLKENYLVKFDSRNSTTSQIETIINKYLCLKNI